MGERWILAVVSDLMFIAKIGEAAKKAGLRVDFAGEPKKIAAKARESPALIILDLNLDQAEPVRLISDWKSGERTRSIPVIGYLSHVQVDLKKKAEEAGCNVVVARSTLSQDLPALLATNLA